MENFSSLKPSEFYLREIKMLSYEWLEVNENDGEYTIDWN